MSSEGRPVNVGPAGRSSVVALAVLLPFLLAGCITVSDVATEDGGPAASDGPSAAATAPASSGVVTPAPAASPTPAPQTDALVIGFLPNWLIEQATMAMDLELVDLLAFHGIEASGNGRLVSEKPSGDVPDGWEALDSPAFSELKGRAQAAGVKVIVTIQRMGWTDGALDRTRTLLESQRSRRGLAGRIADFVADRGFDGVNLDVEPVPEALADEYVALVRDVRAALDEVDPDLHLSVDVLPGLTGYDLAQLTGEGAADLAVIMGYNFRTSSSGTAGSTSPLRDKSLDNDLARSVSAALSRAPGDRLALALPWYGIAWPTGSDEPGAERINGRGIDGPASPPYADAIALAGQWGRRFDADQVSAWSAYPSRQCSDCRAVWRQLWYDDPDSFGTKVAFALEEGLAGVGVWALGHEAGHEEMWSSLRQQLQPVDDVTPPGGTPSLDPESIIGDLDGRDIVDGSASLLLFARDEPGGSGLALARVGLDGEVDADGQLVTGVTYPPVERVSFPLGDPATGGSDDDGPRTISVQWRDVAGNWSPPVGLDVWVQDPVGAPTPDDL